MRGGFAAALRAGPEQGGTLLRELLRDVVHRDIVTRHSLRTARPLMTLALHLLAHPGQPLSLQALSKGLGLPSVAQTGRLVEYLQDAWLMLAVPRFSSSFKQRVTSPPKYYAVDTGLAAANSPNPTPDLGRKLENAVLLALRRRGAAPTFATAPHEWECDFVTTTWPSNAARASRLRTASGSCAACARRPNSPVAGRRSPPRAAGDHAGSRGCPHRGRAIHPRGASLEMAGLSGIRASVSSTCSCKAADGF